MEKKESWFILLTNTSIAGAVTWLKRGFVMPGGADTANAHI